MGDKKKRREGEKERKRKGVKEIKRKGEKGEGDLVAEKKD
jgi:hypothetical protein